MYSEYAWDAINNEYKLLDVKAYTLATADDFKEPDSQMRSKIVSVGAAADVYGSYIENPEFLTVWCDSNNHLILGIKTNGDVVFGDGKTSIDPYVSESLNYIDNPEYLYLIGDNSNKLLWGIKKDGDIVFGAGCPSQIKKYVEDFIIQSSTHEVTPEQFGAKGDGVTDDYDAFVAAVNSGCNKIILRNGGKYKLTQKLVIDKPLTMEGVVYYATNEYTPGTLGSAIIAHEGIEIAAKNVILRGFSITTNGIGTGKTAIECGYSYDTNHRITLEHIQITHSGIGIHSDHGWCTILKDVYIANCVTCLDVTHSFAFTAINLNLGGSGTTTCLHISGVNANFICANIGINERGLLAEDGATLTFYNSNFEWDNPQEHITSAVKIVNSACTFKYCTFGTHIAADNVYAMGGENSIVELSGCSLWHKPNEPEQYHIGHFWNPDEKISKEYSINTLRLDNYPIGTNTFEEENGAVPSPISIYPSSYSLSIKDEENGGTPVANLTENEEQAYINAGYLKVGFMYFNTSMNMLRTFNGTSFN